MLSNVPSNVLELLKSVFDWGAVILLFVTFVVGTGALLLTRESNKRQSDQIRQFDGALVRAKTELGTLEGSNLQLRIDLESEQHKNAEAQLALTQNIEHLASPRRIWFQGHDGDDAVRKERFAELEKYAGRTAVVVSVPGFESEILASDIAAALTKSRWKAGTFSAEYARVPLGLIADGVQVRTVLRVSGSKESSTPQPADVGAILGLLNLDLGPPFGPPFGVHWEPDLIIDGEPFGLMARGGFQWEGGVVLITVGRKPNELFFATHKPEIGPTPKKQ